VQVADSALVVLNPAQMLHCYSWKKTTTLGIFPVNIGAVRKVKEEYTVKLCRGNQTVLKVNAIGTV